MKNKIEKEVLKYFGYSGLKRKFWNNEMCQDVERLKKAIKLTQQKTAQSIFDELDIIIQSIENDCLKLNPANDYEEGIRLNLQGVKIQLEELKKEGGCK